MPEKNRKSIQVVIIQEMIRLCSPNGGCNWGIKKAAKFVSDEFMPIPGRRAIITISPDTAKRYYKHWLDFGMLPCDTPRDKKRKIPKAAKKWSPTKTTKLLEIVDNCPVLYLDEISDKLKNHFHETFSKTDISRKLRKEGYSRKVVYEKATQQIQHEKDNFIETLRHYIETPEMAIFVDESNKDRKAARRKYGWSRVGTPVNYRALFNMDTRYTFIGVADCFGFVPQACDVVMHQYREKEECKPVDSERFVQFVLTCLVPVLGNYERKEARSVVIMDNCSIHLDRRVREAIEGAGAVLVYSAPFSPELIPIEYMFHQWKSYLKRYHVEFNINWMRVHDLAVLSITPQQGLEYFKKTTLVDLVINHPLSNEGKALEDLIIAATVITAVVAILTL